MPLTKEILDELQAFVEENFSEGSLRKAWVNQLWSMRQSCVSVWCVWRKS